MVPPEELVTPRALADWRMWKRRLEEHLHPASIPVPVPVPVPPTRGLTDVQDTVGAVALDAQGATAAGVSRCVCVIRSLLVCLPSLTCRCHLVLSGGLLLKWPGRIGEVRLPTFAFLDSGPDSGLRRRCSVLGVGLGQGSGSVEAWRVVSPVRDQHSFPPSFCLV